jgi:hypothetical protein
MKTPINDGGAAFPAPMNGPDGRTQHGMTLRDYFAGQAMAGIMAGNYTSNSLKWVPGEAYALADVMLAARERKEEAP